MMNTFKSFLECDSGATAIEYGLIVGAVGLAIAAGLSEFGSEFSSKTNTAGGKIADQVNKIQPAAGQ
jgi:pilus assembly protein Flp/PilA